MRKVQGERDEDQSQGYHVKADNPTRGVSGPEVLRGRLDGVGDWRLEGWQDMKDSWTMGVNASF